MPSKETQSQIQELEGLIRGHENEIRVAETNMGNARFVDDAIASHRERIEWHRRQIEQLEFGRDHGQEIIDTARAAIKRCRGQVKRLRFKHQIEKLRELEAEIAALSASDKTCEVVFEYGPDKRRACGKPATTVVSLDGRVVMACEECGRRRETEGENFRIVRGS